MMYEKIIFDDLNAIVQLSTFVPDLETGVAEFHATVQLLNIYDSTQEQFSTMSLVINKLITIPKMKDAKLVWKRFFVSDAINQSAYLSASCGEAVSIVQQQAMNCTKVSVWLYFVEDVQLSKQSETCTIMQRPDYKHIFHTQMHKRHSIEENSSPLLQTPLPTAYQTDEIFNNLSQSLSENNCTIKENCIRTWIFVQNVDIHYSEMVRSRLYFFENQGLNARTHYIASTGIEGRYIYPDVVVLVDAYSISGVNTKQIKHLKAATHLNPTHEYGVTFERGTSVDYGDRRHIFISGTASINNRGEIMYPLDIKKQIDRTFENIEALLSEAEANMCNVMQYIVYLRDTADYAIVNNYIQAHYPNIPHVIVLAPVCRPGWLIEIECIAIKSLKNNEFAAF